MFFGLDHQPAARMADFPVGASQILPRKRHERPFQRIHGVLPDAFHQRCERRSASAQKFLQVAFGNRREPLADPRPFRRINDLRTRFVQVRP